MSRADQPAAGVPVEVFFDPVYGAADIDFDTTRKAVLLARDLGEHPIEGIALRSPAPATRADLERIHDPAYVSAVLCGAPRDLARSSGLGWDQGHLRAVLASSGGCIEAARSAWRSGIAGTLSSGMHHAHRTGGLGYCTLNGIALAALSFLDCGAARVLIVDLDAHCGGGTADILGDDRVRTVDVSTSGFDHYDAPKRWSLDVVWDADRYLEVVDQRLAAVPAGSFDAVVYNAGMDPHEDCAIGGLAGITNELLAAREQLVFDFAAERHVPVAFALAGGYSSGAMGTEHLTALHRLTLDAAVCSARTLEPAA